MLTPIREQSFVARWQSRARFVSSARFKMLNRNRKLTGTNVALVKDTVDSPALIDPGSRLVGFTISTGCIDRERDTISVDGWKLDNYLRNPTVLWGHDASRLPIGRAVDVRQDGDRLRATVEFIPPETPEGGKFAEAVFQLACRGFISATSVGFRPLKWSFTDDPERGSDDWFPGIDFSEQELLEFSVVTVPANPEALIEEPVFTASDTPPGSDGDLLNDGEIAASVAAMKERRHRTLALLEATQ